MVNVLDAAYNAEEMSLSHDKASTSRPLAVSSARRAIAICWSLVVTFGGGVACGWCISHFGWPGAISLTGCGAFAGYISLKITQRPSRVAAWSQAFAICLAYFVAETCWLHWNTRNGEASWWAAVGVWPIFVREYVEPALIGAVCAAFGAWFAYSHATGPGASSSQPATPVAPP
jgi:hypothetical protein